MDDWRRKLVTFINVWFCVDVVFNLDLYEVVKIMMDDWELILQYMQLVMKASHLPKWGHYVVIDIHKDLDNEDIYKKFKKELKE